MRALCCSSEVCVSGRCAGVSSLGSLSLCTRNVAYTEMPAPPFSPVSGPAPEGLSLLPHPDGLHPHLRVLAGSWPVPTEASLSSLLWTRDQV